MLAALVVCAALALAPTPDRAAGEVASAGPVASSDPLSMLQQNLADLEERTASARAALLAHQAQHGAAAEHGPAAVHGVHGASRGYRQRQQPTVPYPRVDVVQPHGDGGEHQLAPVTGAAPRRLKATGFGTHGPMRTAAATTTEPSTPPRYGKHALQSTRTGRLGSGGLESPFEPPGRG